MNGTTRLLVGLIDKALRRFFKSGVCYTLTIPDGPKIYGMSADDAAAWIAEDYRLEAEGLNGDTVGMDGYKKLFDEIYPKVINLWIGRSRSFEHGFVIRCEIHTWAFLDALPDYDG